ncbi:MAG TPA: DUF1996 domain-containing protein [Catenuloplanes sp.]|jgi:hypothetical protein
MPSRRLLAAVTALVTVLSAAWLVVGNSPNASAAAAGLWKIDCKYSHSLPDDPILYPGRPGASHLHDFFGNVGARANSTYASLNGVTSTCAKNDRAAYWAPALYQNGRKINPTSAIVYYTTSAGAPNQQRSFPPDMRIIIGNSAATTAAQREGRIEWGCSDNTQIGKTIPRNCASGHIQVRVPFPPCWNGRNTTGNALPNLRYPKSGACPADFPVALVGMRFNIVYRVGTTTGNITLSSGNENSIHVDFWNIWDQRTLDQLVRDCLHGERNCGHFTGTSPGRNP